MKVQLFLGLLIILVSYSAGDVHLCGRILSETVNAVCEKYSVKRSMPYNSGLEQYWLWLRQHNALALASSRGKRDGIANECCLKSCSMDELLSYC